MRAKPQVMPPPFTLRAVNCFVRGLSRQASRINRQKKVLSLKSETMTAIIKKSGVVANISLENDFESDAL
jgi:hypothetical protein